MLNTDFFIDTNHMCFPFAFFFFPQEKAGALLGSPRIVLDDWVYIYIYPQNTCLVSYSKA